MGGLVAVVTNRDAAGDAFTQKNLKAQGIWFDYETGLPDGRPSEKASRWKSAAQILARKFGGKPVPSIWVGDQVGHVTPPIDERQARGAWRLSRWA